MPSANKTKLSAQICRLFQRLIAVVLILALAPVAARSEGKDSGGGGGTVHDQFIAAGHRVLYYLRYERAGQGLVQRYNLNLCRLRETLRERLVYVSRLPEREFVDWRGSPVDAHAFPWRIEIQHDIWDRYFQQRRDIYNLVFKEMIRSESSHFNDALVISNQISPFPAHLTLQNSFDQLPQRTQFHSWLQRNENCLSSEDQQTINMRQTAHSSLIQNESPMCQRPDSNDTSSSQEENGAEFLLRKARLNGCRIQARPCFVRTRTQQNEDGSRTLYRFIERDGRELVFALHSVVSPSGERNDTLAAAFRNLLDSTYMRLLNAGICSQSERVVTESSDWRVAAVDLGIMRINMLYADPLRANRGNYQISGLFGAGSQVRLIDNRVHEISPGIHLIKVQVLNNTISEIRGSEVIFVDGRTPHRLGAGARFEIIQPGTVGWITVVGTKFHGYLDRELMEIVEPITR